MEQIPPIRDKVRLRRSSVFTKRPTIYDIEDGELAINYNAAEPGVFLRVVDDDEKYEIRKIGPTHVGPVSPNSAAGDYDFPEGASHTEMWVDTAIGEDNRVLKVWDKNADNGAGDWIRVRSAVGITDGGNF
jgi:hypothetical protein